MSSESRPSPSGSRKKHGFRFYFWIVFISILLGVLAATFNLGFETMDGADGFETSRVLERILIYSGLSLVILSLLNLFFHWLFSWRNIRRCLIAFAFLLVIVAIFYAEEDWRGKRDWENYKHEWETKGEHFDFASFIPPPVPDDKNFALTPIVASCYGQILDRNGHHISPENTNIVNRLKMGVYREKLLVTTNMLVGSWQKARFTDLKAWQDYYRTMFLTNFLETWSNDVVTYSNPEIEPLATNEFPTASQPQSPAADVLLALSKYDSVIENLRQASQLPDCRFPLNYDEPMPYDILVPHLSALKSSSQVLQLRAIAELQDGQAEKALEDVKLILYLANSIRAEPILISHLVRTASVNLALQPIWEGLSEHKWSDTQAAAIESELSQFDFPSDYDFVVRGELAADLKLVEHERRTHNAEVTPFLWDGEDCDLRTRLNLLYYYSFPSGWFYQNELALARAIQQSLRTDAEVAQQILSPAVARRSGDASGNVGRHYGSPYYFFVRMFYPALGTAANRYAFTQASVDMVRIACALERYRLAHGEYPQALDTLTPQFIEKIPHDVINGQPLHYRQTDDGKFILYSVGWNETDDGGIVDLGKTGRLVDLRKGDWVWHYPSN